MDYEKKLDISKFMGWPPVKELGGWRFKDHLDLWEETNSPRRVSILDNHPNELGHIAVCDKLYKLLQNQIKQKIFKKRYYNIIGVDKQTDK